jgi:hypothetical protein
MRTPSPQYCRLDLAPPLADRFISGFPIDYGPVLLLMPFGFHLVIFYLIDALPSGVQLSPASEVLSPLLDMARLCNLFINVRARASHRMRPWRLRAAPKISLGRQVDLGSAASSAGPPSMTFPPGKICQITQVISVAYMSPEPARGKDLDARNQWERGQINVESRLPSGVQGGYGREVESHRVPALRLSQLVINSLASQGRRWVKTCGAARRKIAGHQRDCG